MRSTHWFLASMVALSGVALAGCPSPEPTASDAGPTPGTDTGPTPGTDAGPTPGTDAGPRTLPALLIGEDMATSHPPSYGCRGENTAPTAGAPVSGTVTFSALALSSYPVVGGSAQLFPGATVRASCDGDCVAGTTNALGQLEATMPGGGWFGYRLAATGGAKPTVAVLGHFYAWPSTAGGNVTVTAISETVASVLTEQIERELSSATSAVSGSVRDCNGEEVANAEIHFYRGDAEIISEPDGGVTSPRITGLSAGAIPAPTRDGLTGFGGRFAGLVSPGAPIRIEAWGSIEAGTEPVLLGCEEVVVEANTVTVAVVPALRTDADYGAGHPCAGRH